MRYQISHLQHSQKGAVLAISLLLLLVLTLVAVTAMDGTNMSYKMSANTVYHNEAFNNSESTRVSSTGIMYEYLKEGDWVDVDLPAGLSVDPDGGDLGTINKSSEQKLVPSSLQRDLSYSKDGVTGDIYVLTGASGLNDQGGSISQYKGYVGTGNSAGAAGGSFKYYEFRSLGTSKGNAKSWTASDFKYVP